MLKRSVRCFFGAVPRAGPLPPSSKKQALKDEEEMNVESPLGPAADMFAKPTRPLKTSPPSENKDFYYTPSASASSIITTATSKASFDRLNTLLEEHLKFRHEAEVNKFGGNDVSQLQQQLLNSSKVEKLDILDGRGGATDEVGVGCSVFLLPRTFGKHRDELRAALPDTTEWKAMKKAFCDSTTGSGSSSSSLHFVIGTPRSADYLAQCLVHNQGASSSPSYVFLHRNIQDIHRSVAELHLHLVSREKDSSAAAAAGGGGGKVDFFFVLCDNPVYFLQHAFEDNSLDTVLVPYQPILPPRRKYQQIYSQLLATVAHQKLVYGRVKGATTTPTTPGTLLAVTGKESDFREYEALSSYAKLLVPYEQRAVSLNYGRRMDPDSLRAKEKDVTVPSFLLKTATGGGSATSLPFPHPVSFLGDRDKMLLTRQFVDEAPQAKRRRGIDDDDDEANTKQKGDEAAPPSLRGDAVLWALSLCKSGPTPTDVAEESKATKTDRSITKSHI